MDREFFQTERTQNGWHLLFQKLHQIARTNAGSQLMAKKPTNFVRNRYRDVLPRDQLSQDHCHQINSHKTIATRSTLTRSIARVDLMRVDLVAIDLMPTESVDETRVKLNDEENDYINANYVKADDVGRNYILTQGPLQHTCSHFWKMIWEQKTAGILMLNKCIERGMNKCYPYWPQAGEEPMQCDQFRVENLGCEDESFYHLSHLKLENTETEESRVVLHFHYIRWPDFGVPQTPDVFLDFLYAVRSSGVLGPDVGPCVVHCSAGIGRSGTLCLVDVCLAKLEQTHDLSSLDTQTVLLDMRRQRLGLIQTPDQLRFSYIAILQGAMQILGIENTNYTEEVSESESESESEELVESEGESEEEEDDQEARLERKYPNLTRAHTGSYDDDDDDVPPPIPPRPPETYARVPPSPSPEEEDEIPPPPPDSLPPGPPKMHPAPSDLEEEHLAKRIKLSDANKVVENDEYGFQVNAEGSESGEEKASPEKNGEVEVLEESGSEDESPPPIPARSHSLTPERTTAAYIGTEAGGMDVYSQNPRLENGASHFLGARGGGQKITPPLENHTGESPEIPPQIPPKQSQRRPPPKPPRDNIDEEEQALLSELNELERLVSRTSSSELTEATLEEESERSVPRESPPPPRSTEPAEVAPATRDQLRPVPEEEPSTSLRKRQRVERQARLANKVNTIKEHMKQQEQALESDWSVSWLLVGFVIMIGYCAYYILS